MDKITIPVLIMWGRYDGTLPVAMADDAFNSIGTAPADKYKVIFENSGHCASFEEPDLWLATMHGFVEKYR